VTRWRFWIGVAAGFLLLLWLLNDILLPFVAVVGVVARHLMGRYHASSFYRGSPTG
jgi:hypothetical protein